MVIVRLWKCLSIKSTTANIIVFQMHKNAMVFSDLITSLESVFQLWYRMYINPLVTVFNIIRFPEHLTTYIVMKFS